MHGQSWWILLAYINEHCDQHITVLVHGSASVCGQVIIIQINHQQIFTQRLFSITTLIIMNILFCGQFITA